MGSWDKSTDQPIYWKQSLSASPLSGAPSSRVERPAQARNLGSKARYISDHQ